MKSNSKITGYIEKDNHDGTFEVGFRPFIKVLEGDKFVEFKTKNLPAINGMNYEIGDEVYVELVNKRSSDFFIRCKKTNV
ncbi:hypothetical protein Amet_2273 [Alkaliphilus metalliredigens QYMF]|uniref:Uncharacterized protein n=1 Tax=Alkaliphilus metalliredigens (strain QYMF) TaxID=293826 RepID=A6TQG2_ALKMQ|nr:hypothetical protein [Alkaliphilus metalliredigens]ABR48430.1 hypothetical protein Amet_2273 [Alkaliphilus metalliredigens QYMF]